MAPRQRPEDTPVRLLRSVAERLEPQKPNGGKRSKRNFRDFHRCGMSWSSWDGVPSQLHRQGDYLKSESRQQLMAFLQDPTSGPLATEI